MRYKATIIYNYPGKDREENILQAELIREQSGKPIIEFCCKQLRESWDDGYIGFGNTDTFLNDNPYISIYKCSVYPEGTFLASMAIAYCPFCGDKICGEFIKTIKPKDK